MCCTSNIEIVSQLAMAYMFALLYCPFVQDKLYAAWCTSSKDISFKNTQGSNISPFLYTVWIKEHLHTLSTFLQNPFRCMSLVNHQFIGWKEPSLPEQGSDEITQLTTERSFTGRSVQIAFDIFQGINKYNYLGT